MCSDVQFGRDLLVLAGPKSAGKTTLLANALHAAEPMFGPKVDACFQATLPPRAEKEFRLPTAEVIRRKTWACNTHLPTLAQRAAPLSSLVVHLDITDFCGFNARPFESTLDVAANLEAMQCNLCAAIFGRYQYVHLATLATPYECCARWYKARAMRWRKTPSANDERLYSGEEEGRAAFAAVAEAWRLFAAMLDNVAAHSRIAYDGETVRVEPL